MRSTLLPAPSAEQSLTALATDPVRVEELSASMYFQDWIVFSMDLDFLS